MCPSFTVDCLETLEEIAIRGREIFLKAGGEEFAMIPALNDRIEWVRAISEMLSPKQSAISLDKNICPRALAIQA
jgi:ferrochelatase